MNDHGEHVAPEAIQRLLGHGAASTRALRSAGRPGLVVKTQNGLVAVIKVRSRDDARREFEALSRARSLGVPVPRPLAFTDDGTSLLAMSGSSIEPSRSCRGLPTSEHGSVLRWDVSTVPRRTCRAGRTDIRSRSTSRRTPRSSAQPQS